MKKAIIILALTFFLSGSSILLVKSRLLSPPLKVPLVFENKPQLLAEALEKAGFTVPSRPIMLGNDLIASISAVKVTFSADKDLEEQVRALQLVQTRLKIDARVPREIDLRFNKVVIKY